MILQSHESLSLAWMHWVDFSVIETVNIKQKLHQQFRDKYDPVLGKAYECLLYISIKLNEALVARTVTALKLM